MKLVFVFAAILMAGLGSCSVNAQIVVNTVNILPSTSVLPTVSQNILTPSTAAWSGAVTGAAGGLSGGGSGPAYDAATKTLTFGFTTATSYQKITAEAFAIQHALDLSNSGIKINGYNYSWLINNSGTNTGTLTGKVEMLRGNTALETYTYNYNTPTEGFELKTGTQAFATEQSLLAGDMMKLSFTGKDSRFWAGYYGPQIKDPSLTLNYTVDPCMGNPLSSPSCPGFNTILTSRMMYAESYAINQALDLVGAGLKINGLNYGYEYVLGGTWCSVAGTNPDGTLGCSKTEPSYIAVGVAVTKNDGSILYSNSHYHDEQNTSGKIANSHVFKAPVPLPDMGGFALVDQVNGTGAVFNKWSNWQYTPDPCIADPLSSQSCPGYAVAYQAQQCSANQFYNSSCPGYAEAMFTRQCTASPLSNPACPGYASAYLTYQCSANPLYSTTCPGYEQANLDAQCIKDSLYSTKCEGYKTAYAIKYLVPMDSTTSNAVNGALSDTAATKANDPATTKIAVNTVVTTISTDGTISTGASATGDTNVDKVIANKATTNNSQPSAAVQLAPPPPPPQQMAQNEQGSKPEPKNNDKQDAKKEERNDKPEAAGEKPGNAPAPQTQMAQQQGGDSKPTAMPTVRQEIQARREAAAKAEAVETGKNLANDMGKAADMETQKAVQSVVIQAMGFTPGFDAYNKQMIVETQFYKPFSVYNNQKTIDNRANLRMFGGTDKVHNDMVESQYNKGK